MRPSSVVLPRPTILTPHSHSAILSPLFSGTAAVRVSPPASVHLYPMYLEFRQSCCVMPCWEWELNLSCESGCWGFMMHCCGKSQPASSTGLLACAWIYIAWHLRACWLTAEEAAQGHHACELACILACLLLLGRQDACLRRAGQAPGPKQVTAQCSDCLKL